MEWIHIPLDNAKPLSTFPIFFLRSLTILAYRQVEMVLEKIKQICEAIENGGRTLIHCAAGLHRTGMIGNLTLLYLGYNDDEAYQKIREAREQTALEASYLSSTKLTK